MPVLHMETVLVRRVGGQIQEVSVSIGRELQQVDSQVQILSYEWQGPSATIFVNEIQPILQRLNQASSVGELLNQRLQREVDEWERIASTFGGVSVGIANGVGYSSKHGESRFRTYDIPKNQGELFDLVTEDSRGAPVKIIQIGENEYLVTIAGTDGFSPKNNWTHALTSGTGMRGDYEVDVHKFINANVPPGAKIHFAGHSQGGIVANNLADNKDFTDRYQIDTITTFGAPVSTRPNPDVSYYRYEANGDIVPDFRGYWIPNPSTAEHTKQTQVSTYEPNAGYYRSGLRGMTLLGLIGSNLAQNLYGTFDKTNSAHRSYGKQTEKLPFDVDSKYWQTKEVRASQENKTSTTGQIFQGVTAIVWQGVDTVVDYPMELLFDSEPWRQGQQNMGLPDLRGEVDRYMDRAGEGLLYEAGELGDTVQTGAGYILDLGKQGISSIGDGWNALWY